ncbi:hypothetical protein GCM10009678_14230 [Actinomadura kijaniata]|uniref:DNA-binding CsgD family transcriptional regulator n=1 Tax=Actinomadura namibiensis TaxID=182080 RepID=A0A7W3LQT5_ACTNM|nr:response regulator transcription factor [Actinomadura namibiensis]MBA8952593.1 DNA-binding CsgD family transcriptional regulator [Actinomadura namibiensis]
MRDLLLAAPPVPPAEEPTGSQLTAQERRILPLIGQGHSNRHIARTMGISEKTVKNHIYSIFRKLGVHSRTEAAVVALKHGWLEHDLHRWPPADGARSRPGARPAAPSGLILCRLPCEWATAHVRRPGVARDR